MISVQCVVHFFIFLPRVHTKSVVDMLLFSTIIVFALSLAVKAAFVESDFDKCIVSDGSDCGLNQMTRPTLVYPGGNTRCAFDTSEKYNTSSEYKFQVMPGTENKDKVLLYFMGGGGCGNELTCAFETSEMVKSLIKIPLFSQVSDIAVDGLLDITDDRNPFKTWTIIVFTYCTGDIYAGNRVLKGNSEESGLSTHLNGANNTDTVLQWVFRNIQAPKVFSVMGCSAGSLGLQVWSQKILSQYPNATRSVISDSYPGIQAKNQGEGYLFSNSCDERFGWSNDLLKTCRAGDLTFESIAKEAQKNHRDVPFGYITSKKDSTQKAFYCLGSVELSMDIMSMLQVASTCISAPAFYEKLVATITSYITPSPNNNVISYIMDIPQHCILDDEILYTQNANKNQKQSVLAWITDIIQRNPNDKQQIATICNPVTPSSSEDDKKFPCDPIVSNAKFNAKSTNDQTKDENNPNGKVNDDSNTASPISIFSTLTIVLFTVYFSLH